MILDPTILSFVAGISVAVISGIIIALVNRYIKNKDRDDDKKTANNDANSLALKELQKTVWRQNKTILIMAKILDDQTAKIHPELSSSLEDIASELLKEST